ncbi:LysE family translocator [Paraburkholderia jirisanensis]
MPDLLQGNHELPHIHAVCWCQPHSVFGPGTRYVVPARANNRSGACRGSKCSVRNQSRRICAPRRGSNGPSAVILASAAAFTAVKWVGASYLFYLGLRALLSKGSLVFPIGDARTKALRLIFWQGFLSDVLNPKVALFYVALLPQFVSAHDLNAVMHLLALGLSCNMVGIATSITYVFFAARMTTALRRNHAISSWLSKAMGALFVGLGLKLATDKI